MEIFLSVLLVAAMAIAAALMSMVGLARRHERVRRE